jgi:hypothetical protein
VQQFFEMIASIWIWRASVLRRRSVRVDVLILDEAHHLSDEVWEEVRPLGNVETRKGKLLQIVLAGQGELDLRMESPALRQLKQPSCCAAGWTRLRRTIRAGPSWPG